MATIQLTPTFEVPLHSGDTDVFAAIKASTESNEKLNGRFRTGHGLVFYAPNCRRFWSPWLNLDIRDRDEKRVLFCRFSPHPSVWTAFMFSYFALTIISFFAMILGSSQWLMQQSAWGFLIIPACLVVGIILWVISQIGQRLAHDEMVELRKMIESLTSEAN